MRHDTNIRQHVFRIECGDIYIVTHVYYGRNRPSAKDMLADQLNSIFVGSGGYPAPEI